MKKYKITIILSLTASLVFSQNRNITTVKIHYPEIYSSIAASANTQWGFDPKIKQEVIQGQVDAFLSILESDHLENTVLTDAIVKNSLPNTREQNIRILKNSGGLNLFSDLKCDWYKVKLDYGKMIRSRNTTTNYEENNNTPSFAKEYNHPSTQEINSVPVEVNRSRENSYTSNHEKSISTQQPRHTYYDDNASSFAKENNQSSQYINSAPIEISYSRESSYNGSGNKEKAQEIKNDTRDQKKGLPPSKPNYNNHYNNNIPNTPPTVTRENKRAVRKMNPTSTEINTQKREVTRDAYQHNTRPVYIRKEAKTTGSTNSPENTDKNNVIWF